MNYSSFLFTFELPLRTSSVAFFILLLYLRDALKAQFHCICRQGAGIEWPVNEYGWQHWFGGVAVRLARQQRHAGALQGLRHATCLSHMAPRAPGYPSFYHSLFIEHRYSLVIYFFVLFLALHFHVLCNAHSSVPPFGRHLHGRGQCGQGGNHWNPVHCFRSHNIAADDRRRSVSVALASLLSHSCQRWVQLRRISSECSLLRVICCLASRRPAAAFPMNFSSFNQECCHCVYVKINIGRRQRNNIYNHVITRHLLCHSDVMNAKRDLWVCNINENIIFHTLTSNWRVFTCLNVCFWPE